MENVRPGRIPPAADEAAPTGWPLQGDDVATSWRVIEGFSVGLVIETRSLPNLLVATLATLPSMSLIPSAPFPICGNRKQSGARARFEEAALVAAFVAKLVLK